MVQREKFEIECDYESFRKKFRDCQIKLIRDFRKFIRFGWKYRICFGFFEKFSSERIDGNLVEFISEKRCDDDPVGSADMKIASIESVGGIFRKMRTVCIAESEKFFEKFGHHVFFCARERDGEF